MRFDPRCIVGWRVSSSMKTEVIPHRGPWKGGEALEYATLEWLGWFSNRWLLKPIGNIPPMEK